MEESNAAQATAKSKSSKSKSSSGSRSAAASSKDDVHGGTAVSMSIKKPGDNLLDEAMANVSNSGDVFARSVAMMAIAHIARGVGFDAIQKSAGDALVDILAKYIQRIGVASKEIAELAGRTQPRATDVVQALNDLEPAPVELKDLIKTLETAKRPFPRDIPSFPIRKRDLTGNMVESTKMIGNREDLPPYVPSFLPPLPNRHTYSSESRLVVDREQDTKRTRLELLGQKSQVQQSLHGLQSTITKKAVPIVHQPSWNAFQGSTGENATENPFVQAPIVQSTASTTSSNKVFAAPERAFTPTPTTTTKPQKKTSLGLDHTAAPVAKLNSNQELGKEEKILNGTFHDGDSE